MDNVELGIRLIEALDRAREAQELVRTNDGDDYDPCGETEQRVKTERAEAMDELIRAVRACVHRAPLV